MSFENTTTNYKPTNILITGGAGFIASNFINYYFNKNIDNINKLVNIDAMYYCANENNINENIRLNEKYILIKDTICNFKLVEQLLRQYNIDTVIHFAAQSHVQNSFNECLLYVQDNIVGTVTLLEACKQYGQIKRFIHVSTDEVYHNSSIDDNGEKRDENARILPNNPYSSSKASAELMARSYNISFKMPIIITRGNNVYGPNQYPEKVIPYFIMKLLQNKKITIHGNGNMIRGFLHVYDTVTAFETILESGTIGEVYNIGCEDKDEYKIIDLAKIIINKIKNTTNYDEWITYVTDRPFNDQRYYITNEKLKQLGWKQSVLFDDGIDKLIQYMSSEEYTHKYINV